MDQRYFKHQTVIFDFIAHVNHFGIAHFQVGVIVVKFTEKHNNLCKTTCFYENQCITGYTLIVLKDLKYKP
jgi:hypothetical protein